MTYSRHDPQRRAIRRQDPMVRETEYRELARRQPNTWQEEPGLSPFEIMQAARYEPVRPRAGLRQSLPDSQQTRMERRLGTEDPDEDVLAPAQLSGEDYARCKDSLCLGAVLIRRLPASDRQAVVEANMWPGLDMPMDE